MTAPALPYDSLVPLFLLLGGAAAVLLLDAFLPRLEGSLGWLAAVDVAAAAAALAWFPRIGPDGTGALSSGSPVYGAFAAVVLLGAFGTVLMAMPYLRRNDFVRGEFFALVLLSTSGGLLLAAARSLLLLFVALETLTVPLYVLAGYYRRSERSVEASMKYFIIGIFSSAFLLYGIALFYGAVGSLDLQAAAGAFRSDPGLAGSFLVRMSLALMVVGIGFKVAAVPFHFWAPDVYQGAPTPVTAFLAVASKAGGFAFGWRVLTEGFGPLTGVWAGLLTWMAVATLALGALLALLQEDLKRLLAYSSIAHAGYALVAIVAAGRLGAGEGTVGTGPAGPTGTEALLFYLLIYAFSALGAFAAVCWVEGGYGGPVRLDQYAGLSRRHPWLAAAMALSLFSLAGIPPAAGFVAKYVLVWSAIRSGAWLAAVAAVLAAVVGLYYYLGVVVAMYLRPAGKDAAEPGRPGPALAAIVLLSCAGVLWLGFWPGPVLGALRAVLGS